MEFLAQSSELVVLLVLTLFQMISTEETTTVILTIEGTSAASIPTATIQSDLIFPLQTMYSSGMRGDASATVTNIQTIGGNTVIDILTGFPHLQKVQVAETGLLTLEYLQSNSWSQTIGGNAQTFLPPVKQRHTSDEGITNTVDIEEPCSVYNSFSWCGDHGSCVTIVSRPYCNCNAGFCGQFCAGSGESADCIGEFMASGDSVNTNKLGTCPAYTTTCNSNIAGGSSCTNDFDCDDFDFCCPTESSSLCCMPGVETPGAPFDFVTGNVPLFFAGDDNCYSHGLLAVIFNGIESTVCNTGWTSTNTEVACKELGFYYGGELNQVFVDLDSKLSPVIKNVDCFGTEAKISQCLHDGWFNVQGCLTSTNVGLFCYDIKDYVTLTLIFQTSNANVDETFKSNVISAVDSIFADASLFDVIPQITSNTDSGSNTLITLVLNFDNPMDANMQTKYVYTLVEAIESGANRALSPALQDAPVGDISFIINCVDQTETSNNVLLSPATPSPNRRCSINDAKGICLFGACAVDSSGNTYCSCDTGYNGEYCQNSVSYPSTAIELTVSADRRKKRATGSPCSWYTGVYENFYDGSKRAYYWHQSGQAYFRQVEASEWEVVQINNDGSESVMLTGYLSSNNPYGSPLSVTAWVDSSGNSLAAVVVQYTPTSTMLPYGFDVGDTMIPKADSTGEDKLRLQAAVALPSGGLYFERETVNRIHINDLGSVSFGQLYDFSAIPSTNQDVNMIFPFLAQQSFTCPGQSIFYHMYKASEDGDGDMLSDINTLIRTQYSSSRELGSFSAAYAIVITWYQGRKGICDFELTCLVDQSNTYQLVLAVSGTDTIGIFFYETNAMADTDDITRGYINSRSTDTDDAISPQNRVKSSIRTGILDIGTAPLFFRIGNNVIEVPECITWHQNTVDLTSVPDAQLDTVQACPYTAEQAQLDFLWVLVSTGFYTDSIPSRFSNDPLNEITCYSPFSQKTLTLEGLSYTIVQTCCYDATNGAQLTTSDGKSGFMVLLTSSTVSGTLSDQDAYSRCCEDTGVEGFSTGDLCPLLYDRRPKRSSVNYSPPFPLTSFGDPHFITYDGTAYTFNPWGEFVLTKTPNFEIQARIINNIGAGHRATAYTAIATRNSFGHNAYVALNSNKDGFVIYTGSSVIDKCANDRSDFMLTSSTTTFVDNLFLYKAGPGASKVNIIYPTSEWVVSLSITYGMLAVAAQGPSTLTSSDSAGLLGIADRDSSNDLTSSTGVVLNPETATDEEIYNDFGMTWRITSEANSILCYKEGLTFGEYYNAAWIPQMDITFNSEAERLAAEAFCEGNEFCMFDLSVLGDERIALLTLETFREYTKNKETLGNTPPTISPISDLNIKVGEEVTITIIATDPEGSAVTFSKTDGSPGTLTGNIFTWTPTSCSPIQIGFTATDSDGAASTLAVPILRCCETCQNGGVCDFDAAVASSASTFLLAACECSQGWEGPTCTVDRDGCADDPCAQFGTTCTDLTPTQTQNNGGIGYRCECPAGYQEVQGLCLDINECISTTNPHQCDANADCINRDGSYECDCRSGWILDADTITCLNINECLVESAGCTQICTDEPGSFVCSCYNGYTLHSDGKSCIEATECTIQTTCSQLCEVTGSGTSRIEECKCFSGYQLLSDGATCVDINECNQSPVPCDPDYGSCTNTVPGYNCECQAGYTLLADLRTCEACEESYWGDNCDNYCDCGQNVASCDSVTGCTNCLPGWEGYNCVTDVNECLTVSCPEQSQCQNTEGSYYCVCNVGYMLNSLGDTCEDVNECDDPVLNECSQVCVNTVGSFVCQCGVGFSLESDQKSCSDLNECADSPSPCVNADNCLNTPGSFQCTCNTGYQLSSLLACNDINECSNPLLSNCSGSCTNSPGSFECSCGTGYVLGFDQKSCRDIDECSTTVASQIHQCDSFTSTCINTLGSYTCQCNAGYAEDNGACADINECTNQLDNCDQICINSEGSFTCECDAAFVLQPDGYSCEPAAPATCSDNCDYRCVDLQDGQGPRCVCNSGYALNANGYTCDDVDECSGTNNCEYQPGCTNVPGTYNCSCDSGYILGQDARSCNDINECGDISTNPCQPWDLCVNTMGDFYCDCPTGYTSISQTVCGDINECTPNSGRGPCSEYCVNTVGSFYCTCPVTEELQVDGISCLDIDECATALHDCSEFAICINSDPGYDCECIGGYNSTDDGRTCTPTFVTYVTTVATVPTTARALPSSPTRLRIQLVSPTNLGSIFWRSSFYQNQFIANAEAALENLYRTSYMPTLQGVTVTGLRQAPNGGTILEFTVTTLDAMSPAEQVAVANILAELNNLPINSTHLSVDVVSTVIVDENGQTQLLSAAEPCALYNAMDACKNDGVCRQVGTNAECRCSSDYTGDYCSSRALDENIRAVVIALAIMGCVLVLLAIMIVGFVFYFKRYRGRSQENFDYDTSSSGSSQTRPNIGSRIHFAHRPGISSSSMWQNPLRRNMAMPSTSGGLAAQFRDLVDEPLASPTYPWGKTAQLPRVRMADGGLSGRPSYRNAPYYYADHID